MENGMQFDFIFGRIAAIERVLAALITAHPQDQELRRQISKHLQQVRDHAIFQPTSEASLVGWDGAVRAILGGDAEDPPRDR